MTVIYINLYFANYNVKTYISTLKNRANASVTLTNHCWTLLSCKWYWSQKNIKFSGIRYCIGRQLANIQMFIVLVRMLQKFDFVTSQYQSEEPARGGFVTMVKFDTEIKIVERTEWKKDFFFPLVSSFSRDVYIKKL